MKMIDITPQYLAEQGLSPTIVERFWSKVRKTDTCWLWGGAMRDGYGRIAKAFRNGDRTGFINAHVLSWILHVGPVPEGMCVLHNCPTGDNRRCVNFNHLWIGTRADNNLDKAIKGRSTFKIPASEIPKLCSLYFDSHVLQSDLASFYGVSQGAISMILSGARRPIRPTESPR